MEDVTLKSALELLQGGGNVALFIAVFAIWRAQEKFGAIIEKLARIEKALSRYMGDEGK